MHCMYVGGKEAHMQDSVCIHSRGGEVCSNMLGYQIHTQVYVPYTPVLVRMYRTAQKVTFSQYKCKSLTFHSSPKNSALTSADILLS